MLHLRKKILKAIAKDKNYLKIRGYCNYTKKCRDVACRICNLRFKVPKEIPVVCHNGSNHYYHFIIKELADEFKSQCECLREITESTKLFPFQYRKKSRKLIKMIKKVL